MREINLKAILALTNDKTLRRPTEYRGPVPRGDVSNLAGFPMIGAAEPPQRKAARTA